MLIILVYCCMLLCPMAVTALELNVPMFTGIRLPKDGSTYDFDFIYNFTKYLHGIHRFNSFVTFAQPHARFRPSFLVVRSLERALVEDFNVPIIVWGTQRNAKFRNNIGLNNLVFVQFNNVTDPILDIVDQTLEGLHFISMLFFYKAKDNVPPTAEEIHAFFNWCWSKNMVNVALTFQLIWACNESNTRILHIQNHVYNYSPFPKLTVFNLTDEVRKGGGAFAVDRVKNVKGYIFKTLLPHLPPWVYLARKMESCQTSVDCPKSLSGSIGFLYTEYIKFIGGGMDIVEYYNLTVPEIREKIVLAAARKEIDISTYPFSDLLLSPESVEGSYPIGQTNVCIIVPMKRSIEREEYLLQSFQPTIWLLVVLTFIALLVLQFCFGYEFTPMNRNPITLCGYALLATASVMFNQVSSFGIFQASSPCYKLVHLVILLMAFVLSNTYTASLTSLLTTMPAGDQIDTVDEFLASGLTILARPIDREFYFDRNYLPAKLTSRIKVVDKKILAQHLNDLNNSYAYLATAVQWQLLDQRQQHFSKPRFRMPSRELCTGQFFLKIPLQWDSPFYNSLTLFFMITHESGLSLKWTDMTKYEYRKVMASKTILDDIKPWKPLCLKHFRFAARLVFVIWALATLCFVGEVLWFILTKKRNSRTHLARRPIRTRAGKYYKQATRKYLQK